MGYANNVITADILDAIDPKEECLHFLDKLEYEGGTEALLDYGGITVFPAPVKWAAQYLQQAHVVMDQAIRAYAHRYGVECYG